MAGVLMNLIHPWYLLGAAAVALPVIIHWLTRPRPTRLPLSTIRFVMDAVRQRRARYRLRDLLILLLRTAAILLLALAFARPLIGAKPVAASDSAGSIGRVVILDQSQSMAAVWHGAAAFERARPVAARYLSDTASASADLILAAARPHAVVDRLTSNFDALRQELSSPQPLPERMDIIAAINSAAELLSSGPANQRRELVIISDFQRSSWSNADFSALPADTHIQVESVAPPAGASHSNLAVLRITPRGRVRQNRPLQLDIEIGNYTDAPSDVHVQLSLGQATTSLHGLCSAMATTILSTTIEPAEAGWQAGQARIVDAADALAADDARPFVLNVKRTATYALITRDPSAPSPTSSHFLERALIPAPSTDPNAASERVRRIDPSSVDAESLSDADLIVLDHPGKLPQPAIGFLSALLRRGRPLLYVAAESVDATNLKLLADAAGSDLKMPVVFEPAPVGAAASRHDLFLADVRKQELPFNTFGESLPAAIGPLRFGGGLASRPVPGGLTEDILATYSDRSACLITASCGAGTLAVLNADLNESNIVGSPVFVPLLEELVNRLLTRPPGEEAVSSGEPLAIYLPADAGAPGGLTFVTLQGAPMDPNTMGTLAEDGNQVLWRWSSVGPPGVYGVQRDKRTILAAASAIPASESDLTTMDMDVLKGRLAGGRDIAVSTVGSSGDAERRDVIWAWLLVACAGCILAELLALRLFRT